MKRTRRERRRIRPELSEGLRAAEWAAIFQGRSFDLHSVKTGVRTIGGAGRTVVNCGAAKERRVIGASL